MHTRDRLTYPQCKCMDCARARNERLKREALRRHPTEYRAIEDDRLVAEAELEAATEKINAARQDERELIEQVRSEIETEQGRN